MSKVLVAILIVVCGVFGGDGATPHDQFMRRDESSTQFWVEEAQATLRQRHRDSAQRATGHARNVVLFLADGMSMSTQTAARILLGQRQGQTGEEHKLSFDDFPTSGFAKTYCLNWQVPDSACTATAYLCGVKANMGTVGVNGAVPRHNCTASMDPARQVDSIAQWALADGRDAGIVTTTRVTHASPAGAFANAGNRNWENDESIVTAGFDPATCPDITQQLVHGNPGSQFKVILGGGRRNFLPNSVIDEEGTRGTRIDGRNLIEEWQAAKAARNASYKYIWNREELLELGSSPPDFLLGLFEGNHMHYHLEADNSTEPTLAEMTEVAIRSLSRNERGFFLFVEGGRIDHAHHDNQPHLALDETIELHKAVTRAMEMLDEKDSLLVVTADHSHVMTINGYSSRGKDILGPTDHGDDNGVPFMTLSYTNGPGGRGRPHTNGVRVDVTQDADFRELRWRTHVDVPLWEDTHAGEDVGVFARGPHHAMFSGLYEQSHIPHRMAYAACIGPGLHACSAAHSPRGSLLAALPLLAMLMALIRQAS